MKTILTFVGGGDRDQVVLQTALAAAIPLSAHLDCLHLHVPFSTAKAKVSRRHALETRKNDSVFAQAWADAMEMAADAMEAEARRRAVEGVPKPVFYKGRVVYTKVREDSGVLLIFLLKGRRREVFGDRVDNFVWNENECTTEQLRRIAAGEHPSVVLASGSGTGGTGRAPTGSTVH